MEKERLSVIIQSYRMRNGLSQKEFANRCGLSHAYISILEREMDPNTGEITTPTKETIEKIANAMGMTRDQLLSRLEGKKMFENPLTIKIEAPPVKMVDGIIDKEFDLLKIARGLCDNEDYMIAKQDCKSCRTIAFVMGKDNQGLAVKKGDIAITWLEEPIEDGDVVTIREKDGSIGIRKIYKDENVTFLYGGDADGLVRCDLDEEMENEIKVLGKVKQIHRAMF